jgi:hypothetical protein
MCFSPNILLEPVSVRDKSRKFPEHLLKRKHCTLTPHVKAADFASPFFYPRMLRRCEQGLVAMQRDAAPKCRKNTATGLPSMLLDWDGANGLPDPRAKPKKNEPEGM